MALSMLEDGEILKMALNVVGFKETVSTFSDGIETRSIQKA